MHARRKAIDDAIRCVTTCARWILLGAIAFGVAPVSIAVRAHAETKAAERTSTTRSEVSIAQVPAGMMLRVAATKVMLRTVIRSRDETSAAFRKLAEDAALAHGVPVDYFLKLIRQESGFNANVVSRAGAQGIAQFMPATAAGVGLKDPFDPAQALPKSAELLGALTAHFGNWGLAAAAYNAGPDRVRRWLAGSSRLPAETVVYVRAITGREVMDFVPPGARLTVGPFDSRIGSRATHRNWELELLASLQARTTGNANAARPPAAGKGEISLCPSCIIQRVY
jgi:Transglycosylase SLT domain